MCPKRKTNPPFATGEKRGLIFKPFRFLFQNNTTTIPQVYAHYRPPKLKKEPKRWYVEYWYRVPEELKNQYPKEWHRFRVFEDINRHKTDEYAKALLKAVKDNLERGYNPFNEDREYFLLPDKAAPISLNKGLDGFMDYCRNKQLRESSIRAYNSLAEMLKVFFLKDNRIYEPIETFTKEDLKRFFASYRSQWSNSTINNNITYLRAIFNWFVREDIIVKSPAASLELLPVKVTKHKYYSDEIAEKLKAAMKVGKPELYDFCMFIYYTATRPQKEARMLQVKHILFDRKLLFVPWNISKNKTDDYIPIGDDLMAFLETRKGWAPDYYIFGGEKHHGKNVTTNWFKPYKEKFGLGEDYTIYSWKHSRAIHLAEAGADPFQIMRLFRHKSVEETMKYLRDLGVNNFTELNEKSKKF